MLFDCSSYHGAGKYEEFRATMYHKPAAMCKSCLFFNIQAYMTTVARRFLVTAGYFEAKMCSANIVTAVFSRLYGTQWQEFPSNSKKLRIIASFDREVSPIELEQLADTVGWCRRPRNRTKKALNNSLLVLGLWRHNIWAPHLIGFARCTGDGVLTATIWDLVIHPLYQHNGLGKGLLDILTTRLRQMQVENVNLFADAKAVEFYSGQGWELEPQGKRCMAI